MKIPLFALNQKITLRRYLGDTAVGPQWGDPVIVRGRFERRRSLSYTSRAEGGGVAEAQETVTEGRLYLMPSVTIGEGDRVEYQGHTYRVMEVRRQFAIAAESHIEAVLGAA